MRQLGLAHGDLEAGRPELAAKAAKSAMRLDPNLVDALLVHALALEKQSDLGTARAVALAYLGAAGEAADAEGEALIARVDEAEPVRVRVVRLESGEVIAAFVGREHLEDPVLNWRVRGEWKQVWMEQSSHGEWVSTLTLDEAQAHRLTWWVETGLGEPLMHEGEDGEGRPFRLALN
ncbi:MAG: hypothetical protein KDA24_18465 [Deltaproteobacteria bacterium]|nr:hypothetical protein [Deltaproteobacteria bacterium]